MGNCASKVPTDNAYINVTLSNPPLNADADAIATDNDASIRESMKQGCLNKRVNEDVIVLLTKAQRQVLMEGYTKDVDGIVPDDIIEVIIGLYMDDSFYWRLENDELYTLRHKTDSVVSFTSCIFMYREIHFQLQITKILKDHSDHGFQLSARLLSKNVVITTTIALQCVETNCGYHNFVENFFESGWPSSTLRLSDLDDDLSELKFICKFDILGIQPIVDIDDDVESMIAPYYKEVRMTQSVSILWPLSDIIEPSYRTDNDDSSLILFYESPQFESGSYVVHFIESSVTERDGFAVMLELFTYPKGVTKVTLKWIVMVIYDGKIIKKSSTNNFALNESSCHSKAFSKSDFHFIGESNVFSLSLLTIKVEIEILEIYDECNKVIPWKNVRHWPQYGVFNEIQTMDTMDPEEDASGEHMAALEKRIKTMDEKLNKLLSVSNHKGMNNGYNGTEYGMDDASIADFKPWLNEIGFSRYYELFIDQGFDSLQMIKEINNVHQLNYIGVNLKAHQIKFMNHINQLKTH